MLINFLLLAAFAFFSFTEKGQRMYATRRCSLAILAVSAFFVVENAFSLVSYASPMALLGLALWGYMGFQAYQRARPLIGKGKFF